MFLFEDFNCRFGSRSCNRIAASESRTVRRYYGVNGANTQTTRTRSEIAETVRRMLVLCSLLVLLIGGWECCNGDGAPTNGSVCYDHRALLIDGQRRFLISGSIHYPRSTPQMWPKLIDLAKEGGLDVIQTYVFWNGHEQQRGQFYFGGRFNLVRFIKDVHKAGLYVNLRIGPYISAEWNFGGFPEWLREIPGIEFRTNNEPFKAEMQRFMSYIVEKMKKHKLFYWQGGPIILSQVENEYGMIEAAYGKAGDEYIMWAGAMAVGLNTSVPWIMCKQPNAPGEIIDTCNGFYCDDYVPNAYGKPKMWTENWTGWFHSWGMYLPHRPVEDIAYATARFFQKGGSYVNYYMYHGGTNFGRTGAAGMTTSYDYDAPIDEYGQLRQPKWGHLKALHAAIKLCEPALSVVDGEARHWSIPGWEIEIHVYTNSKEEDISAFQKSLATDGTTVCASFISNSALTDVSVEFFGQSYYLPAWSVSILPDCKNVIFNTAQVANQTSLKDIVQSPAEELGSTMSFTKSLGTSNLWTIERSVPAETEVAEDSESNQIDSSAPETKALGWSSARDVVGVWGIGIVHQGPLEQINTTHDRTDYLWYTTTVNVPGYSNSSQKAGGDAGTRLIIETARSVVYVYTNGNLAGGYPTWNGMSFSQPLTLKPGSNSIAVLSSLPGLWYAGPFFEKEVGGLSGSVMLQGVPNVGDMNLTQVQWTHQVGLMGEVANGSDVGLMKLKWSSEQPPIYEPLCWYKTNINAPKGHSPVVLDLGSMGKGVAWINGHHLGRFWATIRNPGNDCHSECDYRGVYEQDKKCFSDCGQPSQRWYHVPREWLKSKGNLLVVFEEIGGNITGISLKALAPTLCSKVSESDPPSQTHPTAASSRVPELHLDCGTGYRISKIEFASFGDPAGSCQKFYMGECQSPKSMEVVQQICQWRQFCSVPVRQSLFGGDSCPGTVKSLAVQAVCELVSY
ncbi:unnamed protein product [Calypogeia fissa]